MKAKPARVTAQWTVTVWAREFLQTYTTHHGNLCYASQGMHADLVLTCMKMRQIRVEHWSGGVCVDLAPDSGNVPASYKTVELVDPWGWIYQRLHFSLQGCGLIVSTIGRDAAAVVLLGR